MCSPLHLQIPWRVEIYRYIQNIAPPPKKKKTQQKQKQKRNNLKVCIVLLSIPDNEKLIFDWLVDWLKWVDQFYW